jgi:hypothetical protein
MKKFKTLWYAGLAIVGIPTAMIIMVTFFVVAGNIREKTHQIEETVEKPKTDTVVVEKRVVVRDTVYIKPKPTPKPVVTIQDTL